MSSSPDATGLVTNLSGGDQRAADKLMPLVYEELRSLAGAYVRRESPGHPLQPTALVHEAYVRLVDATRIDWQGRTHFKAVAARAMRQVLVDHARTENRQKRGGGWRRVALDDAFVLSGSGELDALALHEAMDAMRQLDERQAQVAEMRLFGGLGSEEIARMLETSTRTVERDWKMAQAWLRRELSKGTDQ
jgi:RNA polymerase sigma factor (TIGR02999 family)